MVKNLSAMLETWVRSLDWKDPLEKGMATHSSLLVWRIPWTKSAGLQSIPLQSVRHDWVTNANEQCGAVLSRSVLSTRTNELLNEFFHLPSSCGYCEKRLVVKPKILSLLPVLEVSLRLAWSYYDGHGSLMCSSHGVTKNQTWLSD